jgi:hypothetical protein
MRVVDAMTGEVVWAANAEYGTGGALIRQVESTNNAMKDMVNDFSETFPPRE